MTDAIDDGAPRTAASEDDLRRLARWNDTAADYSREDTLLHELVRAQVERTPDRTAVRFEDRSLAYEELDAGARRIAAGLAELGAGPDRPVGVCLERSPELVTALLGVLEAGACYLPLDPDYPPRRLAFIADDADVDVLLTHEAARGSVPDVDATVVSVDELWRGGAAPEPPPRSAGPDSLAYLMYTSGSTGRPKGVMVEHRSIVNRLLWMQDHFGLGPDDVAVQKTPFSFDVSVWELFWPLMTGASLEVARPGGHRDGGYLARLVEEAGVTVLHFVPSMLELFLEVEGVGRMCESLEHVICSGETLPRDLVNRFYERIGDGATLWNLYGPTEAAVDVTWWRCDRGPAGRSVPIGRPVANTRIHVVDEALEPIPIGEVGELVVAGVQVARGYWKRPERTAEAFVADPPCDPGSRAYRTGDRARWRDDGVVEFLGRLDHQVKIRGQRVELGEVEAALRKRPGVRQAAAVVREDRPGDRRLVGYVVPGEGETPEEADLRRALARELPEAMVPARVVRLSEMPLSPTGKLDRDGLPAPPSRGPGSDAAPAPPEDELETFLAGLWRDLLGVERVGRDDRFFELGASSLHAARFVNRLQDELDAFVYVVTVFDAPTVAEYARFLRRDYPEAVDERFGPPAAAPESPTTGDRERRAPMPDSAPSDGGAAVDEDDLARLREAVPRFPLESGPTTAADRNAPAIFILAPPRSGTTLLRVMLAGHPRLFASSELQLLHFERLGQRRHAFRGRFEVWLEGVIRALMELEGWSPDEARAWLAEREGDDLPVRALYGRIQRRLGDRTLVDKTPSYALDPHALARAERDFREPRYVHLSRHPYAMVESFVSQHMDQVLFLRDHPFGPRRLGELIWTESHRTVDAFLSGIPAQRRVRVRFEDLVRRPDREMRALCDRLDLDFHPALLRPYDDLEGKMVDGVHDDSTPMGDQKLLERRGIDPSVAEKWRGVLDDDHLGEPTWRTAEALGYPRPENLSAAERSRAGAVSESPPRRRRRSRRGRPATAAPSGAPGARTPSTRLRGGVGMSRPHDTASGPGPGASGSLPADPASVAVVGLAGRFPGAPDVDAFWENLREGVESIRRLSPDEMRAAGVSDEQLADPDWVPAAADLADTARFDASFFGYLPRDAEVMDPQHRHFLECAWHALESAAHDPERFDGRIGVFGGVARNTYLLEALRRDPELLDRLGEYEGLIGSEKDFPSTRVAYKLGLRGPAVNVQTACSTSGVALHLACQSLLSGECDLALAGGGRILVPPGRGYRYREGGILSPDGRCRAFDADARGTIRGSGMAFVALKRFDDALADRDFVHAVIRGTAVNNDGGDKVGFTAPAVRGQAAVVSEALAVAGVDADSVGYVEAHGTGTRLGDPVEVAALTRAFRETTRRTGYCALGSVKTNIGHLDAGAALAGVIKAALAVRHGTVPPSLHFERPNPEIDFDRSPFFVADELREWPRDAGPRLAGVSSFGLGGTNFHAVLEEPPEPAGPRRSDGAERPAAVRLPASDRRAADRPTPDGSVSDRPWSVVVLSARTPEALEAGEERLAAALRDRDEGELSDVAYTLQVGRRAFEHRRAVIGRTPREAAAALGHPGSLPGPVGDTEGAADGIAPRTVAGRGPSDGRTAVFLFPGGGSQHVGMGGDLQRHEPVYRRTVEHCLEAMDAEVADAVRTLLRGAEPDPEASGLAERPRFALPALLATEVALARLLGSWGVEPAAVGGHSVGEYAAAHVAGVMSLDDAVALVSLRGRLFEEMTPGVMAAVPLPAHEVEAEDVDGVSVAAVNRPSACVVSGTADAVDRLERSLARRGVDCRPLHIDVAAHSPLVEPIVQPFREFVREVDLQRARLPLLSNVTGSWAEADDLADPEYWVRHLRRTVRFAPALSALFRWRPATLVEVGPGGTLASFARLHPDRTDDHSVVTTMRHPTEEDDDRAVLLRAVGSLWTEGVEIDWSALRGDATRRRLPLPGYAFGGDDHWLEVLDPERETHPPADDDARPGTGDDARPGTGDDAPAAPLAGLILDQIETMKDQIELLAGRGEPEDP